MCGTQQSPKMATYEEWRRQRLEENKKRMEELNLTNLSRSLKPTRPSPKRPPKQQVQVEQPRRSTRVANKPPPNYTTNDPNRVHAMQRAQQLQAGLDSKYPSFVKSMAPAHVSPNFQLIIPIHFSKNHLPSRDTTITLLDEEGNEFSANYVFKGNRLSCGWKDFSIDNKLVDGDALVFHLVKPKTFEVYVVRASKSEENERTEEYKEDDYEDKYEDSDVAYLTRSAKRIRASRK